MSIKATKKEQVEIELDATSPITPGHIIDALQRAPSGWSLVGVQYRITELSFTFSAPPEELYN